MVIDHMGIVVSSIPEGIKNWEKLFGYVQSTEIITNTRQKVKVVFLKKSDSVLIKLIEPTDETSPIYQFSKRGGGLHHICFKCDNMEQGINTLKEAGARLFVPPQPGEAFNNQPISFLLAPGNLNIELIDTNEKAGLL